MRPVRKSQIIDDAAAPSPGIARQTRRRVLGLSVGAVLLVAGPETAASAPSRSLAPAQRRVGGESAPDLRITGDGVTDDTAAINAALARGGPVYLPAGTYLVNNLRAGVEGTWLHGDGPATVLRKNGDGPALTVTGARVRVSNLAVDGAGARHGGPGIAVVGDSPHLTDLEVREARDPAVHFPVAGAGRGAIVSDCVLSVWQGRLGENNASTASVWLPDDRNAAGPLNRQFSNIHADACLLFSDHGSESTRWVAGTGRSFATPGQPVGLLMSSCRLASSGTTTTVGGTRCAFTGNAFAGDVVLAADGSTFVGNVAAGALIIARAAVGTLAGLNSCVAGVRDQR
jgi:hypothetical protein